MRTVRRLLLPVAALLVVSSSTPARASGMDGFGEGLGGGSFPGITTGLIVAGAIGASALILPAVGADISYAAERKGERRMAPGWRGYELALGSTLLIGGTAATLDYGLGHTGTNATSSDGLWVGIGSSVVMTGLWFVGHAIYHLYNPAWAPTQTASGCAGRPACWNF